MLRPLACAVLLTAVWSATALAQAQRPLRGRVIDGETGSPITAARGGGKGTRISAATTSDGRFALTAPEVALTLDVRRIGFVSASVPVDADQNEVEIKLKPTALQLSELVVTGQATSIAGPNVANGVIIITTKRGAPGPARFSVTQR